MSAKKKRKSCFHFDDENLHYAVLKIVFAVFFFCFLFFFYQQYRSKRSHSPYFQIVKLLNCTIEKVFEKDSKVREGVVIGSFLSFQAGSDILSHKCFHSINSSPPIT